MDKNEDQVMERSRSVTTEFWVDKSKAAAHDCKVVGSNPVSIILDGSVVKATQF